jgi:hypothetical protein
MTGSSSRRKPCAREGCPRTVKESDDHPACCFACRAVIDELARAERVCQAIGGSTEHWLAAVALNDALTEYLRSDGQWRDEIRKLRQENGKLCIRNVELCDEVIALREALHREMVVNFDDVDRNDSRCQA